MNQDPLLNAFDFYREILPSGLSASGRAGGFEYILTPGSAWPNMTYWPDKGEGAPAEGIPALAAGIRSGQVPPLIMLDKSLLTPRLEAEFSQFRIVPATQWTNMVLPAIAKGGGGPENGLECLILEPGNRSAWKDWMSIVEDTLFQKKKFSEQLLDYLLSRDIAKAMVGYYQGIPVATALLYRGKQAGIYMVATHSSFRRKGFARELMLFCHAVAASLDYEDLFLQSTLAGLSLYRSLGYEPINTISLYYCMA
jgi:ribosomal protein S18 acetylase RimI-like enzyme